MAGTKSLPRGMHAIDFLSAPDRNTIQTSRYYVMDILTDDVQVEPIVLVCNPERCEHETEMNKKAIMTFC